MNIHLRRFLLIGITTLVGLWAMYPPKEQLKLGIDLSGGTILVYEVKQAPGDRAPVDLDELVGALKRRVNPDGIQDIPIRKVGSNRIEIILPEAQAAEVDAIKRKMTDVGSLEFRILASERKDRAPVTRALASPGITNPPKGYVWARVGELVTGEKPTITATTLTDAGQGWIRNRYSSPTVVKLTGKDPAGRERIVSVTITENDSNTLTLDTTRAVLPRDEADGDRPRYTNIGPLNKYFGSVDSYEINYNPARVGSSNGIVYRDVPRGKGFLERYVLVKLDRHNITGENLASVNATQDSRAQPAVGFHLNTVGARRFGDLTRENLPEEGGAFKRHLSILLDNQVMSAPVINSEINGDGIIEGMPVREVDRLISILRAGSLPATINPTPLQEETVGATLGQDTIEKGVRAITISMFVVPIFMLVYYRFAGLVAVIGLILNMILLVGSMALFKATFTLPGLAGLALTIGMAVDANVLIFERMREEKEKGASMSQQIRNGFNKAWSTILDSNVTTMLSGLVLGFVGTEEIRGFAITLIIGLLWNLFTAVYVSRVIFDFCYAQGWIKQLTMMKILDRTNIDFVGPRKKFMTLSVIVITLGLVTAAYRWNSMLNIDFTGGTLVTIQLDPKAPDLKGLDASGRTALVRKMATESLSSASIETLKIGNEEGGYRFNIRTTEDTESSNPGSTTNPVQDKILKKFGPILARLDMTVSEPEAITPATVTPPIADAKTKDAAKDKPKEAEKAPTSWRYVLTFNRPVEPGAISPKVLAIFKQANANPAGLSVTRPTLPNGEPSLPSNKLELRTDVDPKVAATYLAEVGKALADDPNQLFERVEVFGGAVAKDTRSSAIIAIVASWLIMIAYLWLRFKSVTYGLAAVIALVHDVLITLGAVAISPYKIDLPMIAAFLTLIGFSVNDTIVIFDRIREIKGKTPVLTSKMVNDALNQTLSRTILTSFTAWLVVVILYVAGGEGLQGFSFCLVVGFLSGTYSTIYIATPILVDWVGRGDEKKAIPKDSAMATV